MSNGITTIPQCACGGHPQPCVSYEHTNSCGCCELTPVGSVGQCALCGGHPPPCTSYETTNLCGCCDLTPVGTVGQCTLCGGHIPPCGYGETSNLCGCCSAGVPTPSPFPPIAPGPTSYYPPGYGLPGSPTTPSPYRYPTGTANGLNMYGFGPAAGGVLCQLLATQGAGSTWLPELCQLAGVILPILGALL